MEIANVEMAKAWDGEEGDDWTEHAHRYEATGRSLWPQFRAQVPVASTDALLDIGCGTGQSTRDLAHSVDHAFGLDLSSRMLEYARDRAKEEGLTNVEFEQGDAQVYSFTPEAFDVAVSSFG